MDDHIRNLQLQTAKAVMYTDLELTNAFNI